LIFIKFVGEAYLLNDEDENATDEAINYLTKAKEKD